MILPGYNIIHIVPNAGLANEAFDFNELDTFLDVMDEIELWLMFDMSKSYLTEKHRAYADRQNRMDLQSRFSVIYSTVSLLMRSRTSLQSKCK